MPAVWRVCAGSAFRTKWRIQNSIQKVSQWASLSNGGENRVIWKNSGESKMNLGSVDIELIQVLTRIAVALERLSSLEKQDDRPSLASPPVKTDEHIQAIKNWAWDHKLTCLRSISVLIKGRIISFDQINRANLMSIRGCGPRITRHLLEWKELWAERNPTGHRKPNTDNPE